MPTSPRSEVPSGSDKADNAFAALPAVATAATRYPPKNRNRFFIVCAGVAVAVIGFLAFAATRTAAVIDPNAPRVVVEVNGLHCPIQCGPRVTAALERLPFVVRGSVTVNLKTGVVTFAVTNREAVDEPEIRAAIERAGYGVRSIARPDPQPHAD